MISRRTALMGAATLPLATTLASQTQAAAPQQGVGFAPFNRVMVGDFEVSTLLAGSSVRDNAQGIFGMNVSAEEFKSVSEAAGISAEAARFFFTPTLVNTGTSLILFDTGLNGAGTVAAINAAGYTADQVDTVVLTHMHGDHIGGLMTDGAATFANASYVTGTIEFDTNAAAGNDRFEQVVRPFADNMTMLDDGGSVVSGVTAMAAYGHTPGHMAYMLESNGQQLVLGADFANHYVWSLAHPTWEVRFDRDKEAAAATRKKMLDMMTADRLPFVGYHMPWPGIGYVETNGEGGYRYMPHTYQLTL